MYPDMPLISCSCLLNLLVSFTAFGFARGQKYDHTISTSLFYGTSQPLGYNMHESMNTNILMLKYSDKRSFETIPIQATLYQDMKVCCGLINHYFG